MKKLLMQKRFCHSVYPKLYNDISTYVYSDAYKILKWKKNILTPYELSAVYAIPIFKEWLGWSRRWRWSRLVVDFYCGRTD